MHWHAWYIDVSMLELVHSCLFVNCALTNLTAIITSCVSYTIIMNTSTQKYPLITCLTAYVIYLHKTTLPLSHTHIPEEGQTSYTSYNIDLASLKQFQLPRVLNYKVCSVHRATEAPPTPRNPLSNLSTYDSPLL